MAVAEELMSISQYQVTSDHQTPGDQSLTGQVSWPLASAASSRPQLNRQPQPDTVAASIPVSCKTLQRIYSPLALFDLTNMVYEIQLPKSLVVVFVALSSSLWFTTALLLSGAVYGENEAGRLSLQDLMSEATGIN